jgi:sugar lactone lactonase YvrE
VVRFTPKGEVDLVLEVPVAKPTSCSFGGPDFGDLYITTASYGTTPEQLEAAPESGNLFVCRPGPKGFAAAEFG